MHDTPGAPQSAAGGQGGEAAREKLARTFRAAAWGHPCARRTSRTHPRGTAPTLRAPARLMLSRMQGTQARCAAADHASCMLQFRRLLAPAACLDGIPCCVPPHHLVVDEAWESAKGDVSLYAAQVPEHGADLHAPRTCAQYTGSAIWAGAPCLAKLPVSMQQRELIHLHVRCSM